LFSIVAVLVLVVAGTAFGTIYVISPDGLGDYPTIQAAVNAATDGDIIELTDGTFTGDGNRDIAVPSRPITIRSQSGNCTDCVIDCQGNARAEHRDFGDYRLFDTSPCLDTNSPCGYPVGRYGQGCDSPVEEMSWGSVKRLWR
jgi:pectin methylesterase-like acyl-CoA thioesterase